MKILLVNDYGTPTGGAELMTLMFRDRLRERGHDVRLFTSSARPVPVPIAADEVCLGTQGPGRAVLQAVNPWAWAGLRRVLRDFAPDVVHVRMFLSQLSPLVLEPLAPFPALLHIVNYQLICPLNTKRLPSGTPCRERPGRICRATGCVSTLGLARFTLQGALWERWRGVFDVVVANSAWTAARLREDGVAVDSHVYYGVPSDQPPAALADAPTVAFVGRLFAKKGVSTLIAAMRVVVDALPSARLLIVGAGPERDALERQVAALGLAPNVELLGFRPRHELAALLRGAWVQAVPSLWEEPMGVVVLEAMMRGTAVVATNTGGPSEVIEHGRTGLLVPPGDAPALAAALLALLGDRAAAERYGREARAVANERFDEAGFIDRLEALYAETMRRHSLKRA